MSAPATTWDDVVREVRASDDAAALHRCPERRDGPGTARCALYVGHIGPHGAGRVSTEGREWAWWPLPPGVEP